MTFFEVLLQKYGTNEPILSSEIEYRNYSRPWILKQLNRLCEEGKIIRFEKGVYYIPTQTPFGPSLLSPQKVIERKYITPPEGTAGFYSGLTVQNRLRLTTQVPNVVEVYTNNETTRVREITVGKQKVMLRRSRTRVTDANAAVLCFLELMNDLDPAELDAEKKKILADFVKNRGITRSDIAAYAPFYPDKAMRTLVESEAIYSVQA